MVKHTKVITQEIGNTQNIDEDKHTFSTTENLQLIKVMPV